MRLSAAVALVLAGVVLPGYISASLDTETTALRRNLQSVPRPACSSTQKVVTPFPLPPAPSFGTARARR